MKLSGSLDLWPETQVTEFLNFRVPALPSFPVPHSIVILTRDRPGLLPRAVSSALRALRPGGEVLVVDDQSAIPAARVLADQGAGPVRVVRSAVSAGISAARNLGIAESRGEVVFFLDDDDEIHADYCEAVLSGPAQVCDYGFSAYVPVGADGRPAGENRRFPTGPIPATAPLRKQLCGMGMGFWIRREVALATGPFATELRLNEDTEFVCRLIRDGRRAWYSALPGVRVHAHDTAGDLSNITRRTQASQRARDMLWVADRFPSMVSHLGRGYLRHCAKAGLLRRGSRYIRRQPDWRMRMGLGLYFLSKRAIYRLSARNP